MSDENKLSQEEIDYMNRLYQNREPDKILAIDGKVLKEPVVIRNKEDVKKALEDNGFNTENIEIL